MCFYHYIYFDKCQHASFYTVSYCDRAKELGLPKLDSHSPNGDDTDNVTGNSSGSSSSQPPASSANNNNSAQSHSQQDNHNMSIITQSGAGTSFSRDANITAQSEQMPLYGARIPRSALQEDGKLNTQKSMSHATSLLEVQDYGSLSIDIPLGNQSSVEVTHDVFHDDHTHATSMSTTCGSVSDAGTVRGPTSPRKPIPSQWLPPSNAPKLATGQRAKDRGHTKGSLSGSPIEAKALRGTRSMADMSRGHSTEGLSFPTKTAHVAMESFLPSPTAGRSPTKQQRPSAKPAWNSPTGSPLRESPNQQAHPLMRTSPTKTSFLTADTASQGHRRGNNSVATSVTGESVYHSAETSPVRDTAALTLSFKSAAEVFNDDDDHIPDLNLSANAKNEQRSSVIQPSPKAATVGRAGKPRLRIDIPVADARNDAGDRSSTSHASATSSSVASNSPWSPGSALSVSRIPRVATTSSISSARGPTRSSTLKRAQSAKSLTSPRTKATKQGQDSQRQPNTPPTPSVRHVRTVDSSGTTPILSKHPTPPRALSSNSDSADTETDLSPARRTQATVENVASLLRNTRLDAQHSQLPRVVDKQSESSRASSIGTVKATPAAADPAAVDPAIIYSKMSGASGTILDQTLNVPPIIVMMAHNFDIGTFHPDDNENRAVSIGSASTHSSVPDAAPTRGRAEQFVPNTHRQAESEHSIQSSLASDLRATAPEFVPYPLPANPHGHGEATSLLQLDPTTDLLGPMKYELDMYGIPWYYYMYQVQFAFDQGFQRGRSKSPKKHRQKKHPPVPSPAGTHPQKTNGAVANFDAGKEQLRISAVLPPASTISLSEQRAKQQRENIIETIETSQNETSQNETSQNETSQNETSQNETVSSEQRPFSPFASQKALIDRHLPYPNAAVTERPVPGVDLTTIRNVGLAHEANNMPSHNGYGSANNTMPHRGSNNPNVRRNHHRSDNGLYSYRGRGVAGLRMADTVPFPTPVAPQGRPTNSIVGSEACGMIDIVYAAERIGGEACHECEPDHPLD